ncbi:MAG: metal-dependent hydrolase [Anaerolineae bacterium]|nr:metal-dependent hydrolase [Anaerolineae bacterium]
MGVKLTWLGHSAFALDVEGHAVLIDPFLTGNPLAAASPETVAAEYILLSHGHGDHLGDTVAIAKRTGASVVTNFEIGNWLGAKGINKTIGLNVGGGYDCGFMTVKSTPAIHSSSLPDGTYGGLSCGYILTTGSGKRLYFAGDTALFSDMQLIGDASIDLALLPIGDYFTMGTDDALKAIQYVRPKLVMPMHYNTFPPIVQEAGKWANRVSSETGAQPIVLDPGNSYTLL